VPITRPNHVWCSDITYIPVRRGFLYLVAIMDWATRKVLAWRLSNTLDASFCVEALKEAITKYGKPKIMNTDQGSQFTGAAWITTLTEVGVKISMDGRDRYLDNIFIERLWRSLKQEAVYLHEMQDISNAVAKCGYPPAIFIVLDRHRIVQHATVLIQDGHIVALIVLHFPQIAGVSRRISRVASGPLSATCRSQDTSRICT
jgi:transposase InsO family protein